MYLYEKVRVSCPSSIIWAVLACLLLAQPGQQCNPASASSVRQTTTALSRATNLRDARADVTLSFEANAGQTDERVKFMARNGNYVLFLTTTEAVLKLDELAERNLSGPIGSEGNRDCEGFLLYPDTKTRPVSNLEEHESRPSVLRIRLIGANPDSRISGLEEQSGKVNYFIGNDPMRWRTGVLRYARVEYKNIYGGVNLIYYGHQAELEYDFVVMPGADPGAIRLMLEGADKIAVETDGDVLAAIGGQEIRLRKPQLYQEINGTRLPIDGRYVVEGGNQITFAIGAYNATRPLIIDPVLVYSTYLGGSSLDIGQGIAIDADGNTYVTGWTMSSDFPTANPLQPALSGSQDVFVTKISSAGQTLLYSTYLGGTSAEQGKVITVGGDGSALVGGVSFSTNFPTVNAVQPSFGGGPNDAFLAKLSPDGSTLVYSTYLGGSGEESLFGVAVDGGGIAYLSGGTSSSNFPVVNALQPAIAGPSDAVVAKIGSSGPLIYSTFLGGSGDEVGSDIALDASGNAYLAGWTTSSNFPIVNPLQPALAGLRDAFFAKLNAAGSGLAYSSYLGGSGDDYGVGIGVDASSNAYLAGATNSPDFPTVSPLQPTLAGLEDIFVSKITAGGSGIGYSTYLGGSGDDVPYTGSMAIDGSGNVYVAGSTDSSDFPVSSAIQPAFGGILDAFVTKLNSTGSALSYSTYLGGSDVDWAYSLAADPIGNAYATGVTASTNFPIANPIQPTRAGPYDGFVLKIGGSTFVAFDAKLEIELQKNEFEMKAIVALAADSNGIAPLSEEVTLHVGTFAATIPAGSFVQGKKNRFRFEGFVGAAQLEAIVRLLQGGTFEFRVEAKGADLTGTVSPVAVALSIGDDSGSASVIPELE